MKMFCESYWADSVICFNLVTFEAIISVPLVYAIRPSLQFASAFFLIVSTVIWFVMREELISRLKHCFFKEWFSFCAERYANGVKVNGGCYVASECYRFEVSDRWVMASIVCAVTFMASHQIIYYRYEKSYQSILSSFTIAVDVGVFPAPNITSIRVFHSLLSSILYPDGQSFISVWYPVAYLIATNATISDSSCYDANMMAFDVHHFYDENDGNVWPTKPDWILIWWLEDEKRGCTTLKMVEGEECDGMICVCNTDLCNSSSSHSYSAVMFILTLLAGVYSMWLLAVQLTDRSEELSVYRLYSLEFDLSKEELALDLFISRC